MSLNICVALFRLIVTLGQEINKPTNFWRKKGDRDNYWMENKWNIDESKRAQTLEINAWVLSQINVSFLFYTETSNGEPIPFSYSLNFETISMFCVGTRKFVNSIFFAYLHRNDFFFTETPIISNFEWKHRWSMKRQRKSKRKKQRNEAKVRERAR